jgi:hypothetical protein
MKKARNNIDLIGYLEEHYIDAGSDDYFYTLLIL